MSCHRFEDLILDYCDNTLAQDDRARVEAHVAECAECRAFLEIQREIDAALPLAIGEAAPSAMFRERVMRRVRLEEEEGEGWLPAAFDAAGISALAVIAGLALLTLVTPMQVLWATAALSMAYAGWMGWRLVSES